MRWISSLEASLLPFINFFKAKNPITYPVIIFHSLITPPVKVSIWALIPKTLLPSMEILFTTMTGSLKKKLVISPQKINLERYQIRQVNKKTLLQLRQKKLLLSIILKMFNCVVWSPIYPKRLFFFPLLQFVHLSESPQLFEQILTRLASSKELREDVGTKAIQLPTEFNGDFWKKTLNRALGEVHHRKLTAGTY